MNTDIGHLVTVTLVKGVDQGTKMLTLLVPTVGRAGEDSSGNQDEGDLHDLRVGSNLPGPSETYRVESLRGTAQFEFVQTAAQAGA